MIKIGIIHFQKNNWQGGLNYLKNLFYAVSSLEDRKIEIVLFVGEKADKAFINACSPYVTVIQDSCFDRKTPRWFLWKLFANLLRSPFFINHIIKKNRIDVISHSNISMSGVGCKVVNWIPDFQHVHLPHMFSEEEVMKRNRELHAIIDNADILLVSSHKAGKDCIHFDPLVKDKLRVLHFVSQPSHSVVQDDVMDQNSLLAKYDISHPFFYLPNQFWKHKNHLQVFRAVNILKERGVEVVVICSGLTEDYRSRDHIEVIHKYIADHDLSANIRLLGLIDHNDVLSLMRYSLAVINPSLFEGWSSTVEECKSIGKNMVLSDIPVHREQDPPCAVFFTTDDDYALADILEKTWRNPSSVPDKKLEAAAQQSLTQRTREFARNYEEMICTLINAG